MCCSMSSTCQGQTWSALLTEQNRTSAQRQAMQRSMPVLSRCQKRLRRRRMLHKLHREPGAQPLVSMHWLSLQLTEGIMLRDRQLAGWRKPVFLRQELARLQSHRAAEKIYTLPASAPQPRWKHWHVLSSATHQQNGQRHTPHLRRVRPEPPAVPPAYLLRVQVRRGPAQPSSRASGSRVSATLKTRLAALAHEIATVLDIRGEHLDT